MIRPISFSELQQRFGGECRYADLSFTQLETDSRRDMQGKVFLALRGEQFDGHRFCRQAAEAGAVGLVVSEFQPDIRLPQWCVSDTRLALGYIARLNREGFSGVVIGVTGNSGKTTVKEMLGSVLCAHVGTDQVLITEGNLNNDIGVPLTLLRLEPHHRYAVIELGANHLGEIAYSADLACPETGIVLNVTGAHLGEFGSLAHIAQAKGELITALPANGCAIINADDEFADQWREMAAGRMQLDYAVDAPAAVQAADPVAGADGYRFEVTCQSQTLSVRLGIPGRHNVSNALAVCAAALHHDIPASAVVAGLQAFRPADGRLHTVTGYKQCRLIDDSYNANPGSVRAAIDTLMDYPGEHVLILGDIGELGASAVQAHKALGDYARERGVEALFTLGSLSAAAGEGFGGSAQHFSDYEALCQAVQPLLSDKTTVLVKGSRSAGMERVVALLKLPAEQVR